MTAERPDERLARRTEEILHERQQRIYQRTDRLFAGLMALQWAAAVAAAIYLSPFAWEGAEKVLHPHVRLALSLGGTLAVLPILLACKLPGRPITRYVIAVSQVGFSSLLIHVTGGRIETHFHVFGSLAFLAAYCDWRLLVPPTLLIAVDHVVRALFWPETTFGVFTASPWRAVEHAGWVLFEDVFLFLSIRQSAVEMESMSQQTALLEDNRDELQKASLQLTESFDKERAIIEGALDAVVQLDGAGRVTSWNGQAERVFGWRASEALGRAAADLLLPPAVRDQVGGALQQFCTAGESELFNRRVELTGLRKNGAEFPLEMAVTPIRRGRETTFCAFLRDITDRKTHEQALRQAKEQAEAANRTKSEFLANMSHEIRTPLNGILGFTELLIRDADGGDEAERRDYIRTIRTSGKHLLELINDILDLSKIEAGQLQVESTNCSPHHLIAEVVSVLRARAQEKGIGLDYRWESEIPESMLSDPYRVRQLLMNLVGNAVKFTERGRVDVVSRLVRDADEPYLQIEVHDTGIGISQEHLDRVFQPFVQADNSMTRRYGGTGLGLAIAKNICESLGGSLRVESELGRGTTFTATLPTGDLAGVPLSDRPPLAGGSDVVDSRREGHALAGVRILLADDGDTNRKLLQLFLARQGAEVVTVENGELALAAADRQEFDVILMDMQMPVMDGYAATSKLRDRGYQRPIIALTAHAMLGDRKKCEDAGCSGYVTKPVNMDELVRIVHAAARQQAVDEGAAAPSSGDAAEVVRSTLPTDDPEIREIVAEFAATVPQRIEAIDDALRAGDFATIAGLAHALKGAGGTAGFDGLSAASLRLEQAARNRQAADVGGALDSLRQIHERIVV